MDTGPLVRERAPQFFQLQESSSMASISETALPGPDMIMEDHDTASAHGAKMRPPGLESEAHSQSAHRGSSPAATSVHSGWLPFRLQAPEWLTPWGKFKEAERLEIENGRLREHIFYTQNEHDRVNNALNQELMRYTWANRDLQAHHDAVKDLLEVRSRELAIAQQFLTTADPIAEADVIRMVEVLNNEIMQATSILAEGLPHSTRLGADTNFEESEEAHNSVAWIDVAILKLLYDSRRAEDPFLALQVAIQAYFISSCTNIICSWHPEEGYDKLFRDLYGELQRKLAPSIASKWRTLTKSNLRSLLDRDVTRTTSQRDERLKTLLKIAGYPEELLHDSMAVSATNLTSIMESAFKLRVVISEELSSCDLEVFLYHPGTRFDLQLMEDNYGPDNRSNRNDTATKSILCTTEMGVRRLAFKGGERIVETVLLKPKIALESIVDEAIESFSETNNGDAS